VIPDEVMRERNQIAPAMNPAAQQMKLNLRREIREKVRAMTPAQRAAGAELARRRLEQQPVWKQAANILFYAPLPEELDIWPLLETALNQKKQAFLPRFDPVKRTYLAHRVSDPRVDLCPGQFGIPEPQAHCPQSPLNRLDFVLVPGIAFDLHGRRLGRGRGYYDQILADVRGTTCGVAFDEQIVAEIPVEPHDIIVRCILTPSRWAKP
jgi:5-formyltetrahydrofolate cyclo-ligase